MDMATEAEPQHIWDADLGYVLRHVESEFPDSAPRNAARLLELRRFFALLVGETRPVGMISPTIDRIWHTFMLFTPQYRTFCEKAFGVFADHLPRTPDTPVPDHAVTRFIERYRARYGEVPDLWFEDLAPEMAVALRRGAVPAGMRWSGWIPPEKAVRS